MFFKLISVVLSDRYHPSRSRAHSLRCPLSFFRDCVTIKARSFLSLNNLLAFDANPASVHTTNLDNLKSANMRCSSGFKLGCSFLLPSNIENARGIPSPSINNPICTIGLGRCSLERPYCFKPSAFSISKK